MCWSHLYPHPHCFWFVPSPHLTCPLTQPNFFPLTFCVVASPYLHVPPPFLYLPSLTLYFSHSHFPIPVSVPSALPFQLAHHFHNFIRTSLPVSSPAPLLIHLPPIFFTSTPLYLHPGRHLPHHFTYFLICTAHQPFPCLFICPITHQPPPSPASSPDC